MKKNTLKIILLLLSGYVYGMEPQKPTSSNPPYNKPLPPIPVKKATTPQAHTTTSIPLPSKTGNVLTFDQEKSVSSIIRDINKIAENSVSISKNAVRLGKTASLDNIFSNTKESAIIVAKLGMSSAMIASIYLNVEKLSEATPEQKAIARKKILAVLDSTEFKASQTELIKLAADDSLPQVVRVPLQKFASQLAELPSVIVKKYLGQEAILEAR